MKELPFKLPLRVGSTYIEDATGFPVCSAGGNAVATDAIVAAVNAFYTPPAPDAVQRYALDKDRVGMVKDATGNWVQITDHWTVCMERDSLARQVAGLREENERLKSSEKPVK